MGVMCLIITGVAAGYNIANPETSDWIGWLMLGFPVIIAVWHLIWLYTLSQLLDSDKHLIKAQDNHCAFLVKRADTQNELIDMYEELFYMGWHLPPGYFTHEKYKK